MTPLNPLTFPLHGTRLIEASAGTGKTYTVAALYLRLVMGHGGTHGFGRPLMPPEILVVTYTNAATEELRERIRRRLAEAAACFRHQTQGDVYLQALRDELEPQSQSEQAFRVEQAAQCMDEAAIHTIHGWCRRVLQRHAFESGSLFDMKLQTDDKELLLDCACDYWRSFFFTRDALDTAYLQALIKCRRPQDLLATITPVLDAPFELQAEPFELLQQRRRYIETARHAWQADHETAEACLRQAQQDKTLNNNKYRQASLEKWLQQLADWVSGAVSLPDLIVLEKLSAAGLAQGCAKNRQAPAHPAYDALDELQAHLQTLDHQIKTGLLQHAAGDIRLRRQQARNRSACMGFDDLLTRLKEALYAPDHEELACLLRRQYPVALIDEFQDTDPVQYAIFSRIYGNRPDTALVMIGDPKQAIYGFRGADLHTYLDAREDAGTSRYTLNTNYRAATGMVQAINHLFHLAAAYADGPFLFQNQIPFERMQAQGRSEQLVLEDRVVAGLTFWHLPQDGPVPKTGATGYREIMAAAAGGAITDWLNAAARQPSRTGFQMGDGTVVRLRPADIAILVRGATEARIMRQALTRRNVRSVYLSDRDSVFTSDEAVDIARLLRACADPDEDRTLRAALATPALAWPTIDLERLNQDEQFYDDTVARFRRYQRIWRQGGVLVMLRALLLDDDVPARLLGCAGGERRLTNLLHLSELLQITAVDLEGEQALIRWLDIQIAAPSGETEEQMVRLESDEDLVKVITIHKAKGLEYPLVLLPFIAATSGRNKKFVPAVRYHDAAGRSQYAFDPSSTQIQMAEKERLAEDLRLLYVAVTRASHAVWLGAGVTSGDKEDDTGLTGLSALAYLLDTGAPVTVEALGVALTRLAAGCRFITVTPLPPVSTAVYEDGLIPQQPGPARRFEHVIPRDWWITSYSGIAAAAGYSSGIDAGAESDEAEDRAPHHLDVTISDTATEEQLREFTMPRAATAGGPPVDPSAAAIHRFPRGPEAGTFLHGLLEWAAAEGFDRVVHNPAAMTEYVNRNCTLRGWSEWANPLSNWLEQFLRVPLKLPGAAVALAQLQILAYQSEMEFLLEMDQIALPFLDQAVRAAIIPEGDRPPLTADRSQPVRGMLKGFIDLVFEHRERYYVLDYKSNYLGVDTSAYSAAAMEQAILAHRYDLQLVFYTLALHRLLKSRRPDYDYTRHMGGAVYLFLRGVQADGHGVYAVTPPRALITELDALWAGARNEGRDVT